MMIARFAILPALLTISCAAAAQSLPVQKLLTADLALEMANTALAKCRADGFHVAVMVVDQADQQKIFVRDDDALPSAAEFARMKANTTVWFDRPSAPALPPGAPVPLPALPGASNFAGSLPIRAGGKLIGAIAVGGAASGDKDAACAAAGLAKVASRLK